MGATLNKGSHKAAMDTLDLYKTKNDDQAERYLWGASIKFNPDMEIIKSNTKVLLTK